METFTTFKTAKRNIAEFLNTQHHPKGQKEAEIRPFYPFIQLLIDLMETVFLGDTVD